MFAALFLGWYYKLGDQNLPKVLETTLATMQVVLKRTKDYTESHPTTVKTTSSGAHPRPKELRLVQSLDVILTPPLDTHVVVEIPLCSTTTC